MKKTDSNDRARVKLRYAEFEVEGGNAAIQEGLRTFATALQRGTVAAQQRALPRSADAAGRNGTSAEAPVNGEFVFDPPADGGEHSELDVTADAPPPDAKPRQPRKPPEFTVINGLNLDAGDGYPSLETFAKEKGADNHHARYLVAAVWFNRHGGIKEFTANHVFTVYKRLGWGSTPPDAGQPLRDLKRRKLIDIGEKPGTFVVNDAGFDRVKSRGGT